MSSEIVSGDQPPAKPVPWRMVTTVGLTTARSGSRAEQEAVSRLDQARREAFPEGVAAGRQQAEEQIRPAMEGLAQTLTELSRLREVDSRPGHGGSHPSCGLDRGPRDSPRNRSRSRRACGFSQSRFHEGAVPGNKPSAHASGTRRPGSQVAGAVRRAEESGVGAAILASNPVKFCLRPHKVILTLRWKRSWPKLNAACSTSSIDSMLQQLIQETAEIELLPWVGEVTDMVGLLVASRGPVVSIGDFCEVRTSSGRSIRSQVIGFRNDRVLVAAIGGDRWSSTRRSRDCSPRRRTATGGSSVAWPRVGRFRPADRRWTAGPFIRRLSFIYAGALSFRTRAYRGTAGHRAFERSMAC